MATLTHAELHRFNRAVLAVHATRTPADFAVHLLQMLRAGVAADIAVVDWSGTPGLARRTHYDPPDVISGEINAAVHRHLHDNPMYGKRHFNATSISDHLTRGQWRRTALYGEAYGRVNQEDGLALDIPVGGTQFISLNLTRGRRGYADGERLTLSLLGPHVRQVHQRLQQQARFAHAVEQLRTPEYGEHVSAREQEVLRWVGMGKANAEVAELLGIRPGTVKRHLENIYAKLGVRSRHQLVHRSIDP